MDLKYNRHYGGSKIDRSEVARALAKAIAYKSCGKDFEAEQWAVKLVKLLECANILRDSNQDAVLEAVRREIAEAEGKEKP